ncbi:MAG: TldD/PmbA family protein [Alphaproteobacteria bacterium]|nr:TldD/PmbA family protein [Alphaproteobacteria bacterium]
MTARDDTHNLLADLLAKAKSAGADAADAVCFESVSVSHAQRLGEIEKLERSESRDLGLRVFLGKRQAIASSTDLSPPALDALVDRALAMARSVPEDPHCGIAPEARLARDYPADLDIADPVEPAPQLLIERAKVAEDAARAVAGVTNSEGAEAGWDRGSIWLAASNGFTGQYARTSHSVGVSVLAGEGTGMERDYDYHTTVFAEDLRDPAEIGRTAGEKAVRRLNPRKADSKRVPVVYDPRVSGGLLRHLAGAINGAAIARGTSFLKDSMGEQIFATGIEVIDDPHRKRGLRSKAFDGEGVANLRRAIIEDGRLTTWFLDLRSADQLGLESTGHAARGTASPPSPSPTNLYMAAGAQSAEDLIGEIEDGFYITELIGFGINGVTGDYSRGASGFWIEKGALAHPVNEVTVAGNLKDMFLNLTPASDLEFRYGINAPTIRVDDLTVAGQ